MAVDIYMQHRYSNEALRATTYDDFKPFGLNGVYENISAL